jgi:hypothetical protein
MSADDTVHRSSPASGRRSERKRGFFLIFLIVCVWVV